MSLAFLPAGLPLTPHAADVIKAAGLDGWQLYQNPLDANAVAVFQRAAQLGLKIDLMWNAQMSTVNWLAALPLNARPAMGLFNVAPDEVSPSTCNATCMANIQALYNYAGAQVPWVTRNVNISAYAAYNQQWSTYADPYYQFADVPTSDYYSICWSAGDPAIVPLLVSRTRNHVFPKPVAFFSDGGPLRPDECNNGIPYPIAQGFLVQQFFAIQAAGASVIIWWFTPGWPGQVTMGDIHWRTMVAAADQIRPVASDVDADGVVTMVDYRLAREATNEALAGRIKAALKFAWVPMVLKPTL